MKKYLLLFILCCFILYGQSDEITPTLLICLPSNQVEGQFEFDITKMEELGFAGATSISYTTRGDTLVCFEVKQIYSGRLDEESYGVFISPGGASRTRNGFFPPALLYMNNKLNEGLNQIAYFQQAASGGAGWGYGTECSVGDRDDDGFIEIVHTSYTNEHGVDNCYTQRSSIYEFFSDSLVKTKIEEKSEPEGCGEH